nr:methylphloroacetophenone synthase putative cytochrome p450 oxidative enzyme [Cladonia rangiferina]WBO01288.1 methylphloroacetophenone synthase putative cytochrome p450 oxidative enzyme [Cladonia rangiferina]
MVSAIASSLASIWDSGKVYLERTSFLSIALIGVICALFIRSTIYVRLLCAGRSILLLIHRQKLRLAYWTTLRHVPGPWYAKFTGLVLKAHDVAGNRWYYVQALHKKYGCTIRIAPEEVAISDPKVVRKVHAFGTEFRKRQQPGTAFNIFSMSDPKLHRTRQRFYANVFSYETLKSCTEPDLRKLVEMAVAAVRRDATESKDHTADMFKWCMLFGNDAAFQVIYGNTNGLIANNGTTDEVIMGKYLQLMTSWANFCLPIFLLGRWLSPFSQYLRDTFCLHPIYVDLWEEGQRQRDIAGRTVFVQNTKYTKDDGYFRVSDEVKLSDVEIAHDITTFLGAGGEAVGATLVFLIWQVLQMPDLQRELEAEVAGLTEPLTDATAAQLPILNAVIYEALRLYGGGATLLPRYAPVATDLGGYIIPPGTAVTTHTGALHRNPAAWDDPET